MSIKILKPGVQATLQSAARPGYRSAGIGAGGAMDDFAFSAANYLVANNDTAAVMEINFPAPEIFFETNAIIAITGADFSPLINNMPVFLYKPLLVKQGAVLQFEKPVWGAKSYIAVHKGWHANEWLGSKSTNTKVAAGGFNGRALQKNDKVGFEKLNSLIDDIKNLPWQIAAQQVENIYRPSHIIRCVKGPEWYWLTEKAQHDLEQLVFTVATQNDRMGYRFTNTALEKNCNDELVSSPVDIGTIQLLPDGTVIVLMADCQTTGGYPRIASVIKPDTPKLAQLKPNEKVCYKIISFEEAETNLMLYIKHKQEIKNGCMINFEKHFLC